MATLSTEVTGAVLVTMGMKNEEDEEGRVNKFPFSNQKRLFFLYPNQKGLFWKVKIDFLWEGKKMILGFLVDDYSLVVQYSLVEEI